MTFITIGHSDRDLDEFLALLTHAHVNTLVDVRKLAGSRKFPQFNDDALAASLAARGIGYEHIDELTGRRPKSHTVPPKTNGLWRNQSFHNYADYALSPEFEAGLECLRALGRFSSDKDSHYNCSSSTSTDTDTNTKTSGSAEPVVAIMCAEAVWWRCHRRIIADHLLAHGEAVAHVISSTTPQPATLTPGARVDSATDDRARSAVTTLVVYPAPE